MSEGVPGGAPEVGTLPRVSVRAVRGAVQVDVDEREEVLARTRDLVSEVIRANDLTLDDFISVIFTSTADLVSEFPAVAARELGMGDVPLMCARELEIERSMPRVIRLMAHVETPLTRAQVKHVYLNGAQALRRDIAQ
ncbi:chorismate mutase [Kineococcus endophyticus]